MTEERTSPPHHDFTYTDAQGVEIYAYGWSPDPEKFTEPVAAVQIAHGIGEHALRYAAFAEFLTSNGFVVYADDHRGHGATGRAQYSGNLSKLGKLGPGGLRATESAIVQLTQLIREWHPGLKIAQFGHSWGSLMTQRILGTHPRLWDAVVLSGSAFRTPRYMESGELNANWAGPDANGFEWLSRDPEAVRAFIEDPLCFEANVRKLFGVADGLRLYGTPGEGVDPNTPLLIISGSDDPLSRRDGLDRLADAYRARGIRDVSLKLYPGARHELLNETNRDEVYAFVTTWLLERLTN